MRKQRLLILGATGMLGSTLIRWFEQHSEYEVFGSSRGGSIIAELQKKAQNVRFYTDIDVDSLDSLQAVKRGEKSAGGKVGRAQNPSFK